MKTISLEHIAVSAKNGVDLYDCIGETIVLCLQENREVHLAHDGAIYALRPTAIKVMVAATQKISQI